MLLPAEASGGRKARERKRAEKDSKVNSIRRHWVNQKRPEKQLHIWQHKGHLEPWQGFCDMVERDQIGWSWSGSRHYGQTILNLVLNRWMSKTQCLQLDVRRMGSFSWANGNSAEQRAFGDKREGCRTYSVMSLTKHQEMELDREENGRPLMRARTPLPSKLDEKIQNT